DRRRGRARCRPRAGVLRGQLARNGRARAVVWLGCLPRPPGGALHRTVPRQRDVDVVGVRLTSGVGAPAVLVAVAAPDLAVPYDVHDTEPARVVPISAGLRSLGEQPVQEP